MTYEIYHCTGLGMFTEEVKQPRKLVGTVEAESYEKAYVKSQNGAHLWNPHIPCRSTSVGDVIASEEGKMLVAGMGFKKIIFF